MPGRSDHSFTMVFLDSAGEAGRRRSFRAVSLSDAFLQTRNAALDQAVELWKGGSRICTLGPEG
ncbi:hypothetical protein MTR62_19305 [Novosphingobium sp. 1949]|uniref:Uncharacterized protein n=1 Tax=Novosphingobium organovorum TaxID=2930092 RepID=A0ABT0BID7_9SPHN|nr:hypothetical protein [Novosphingobium organovorum]MCJ2184821.1 hypothetical protein [Novosphingobium organovorum]